MAGLLGLVVSLPVLVAAAAAVRLAAGAGPVLICHSGLGANARSISVHRLRIDPIVPPTAPRAIGTREPRLTVVLRVLRVDYLPQLWDVVRGDLSLVGRFPVDDRMLDRDDPIARRVMTAKPGFTGLARLQPIAVGERTYAAGSAVSDRQLLASRLRLDGYYLAHQSVGLDLRILYRTGRKFLGVVTRLMLGSVSPWLSGRMRQVAAPVPRAIRQGLRRIRGRHLFFLDLLSTAAALYVAFALRFDQISVLPILASALPAALITVVVRAGVDVMGGLYRPLWRHASVSEFLTIVRAAIIGTLVSVALFYLLLVPAGVPGGAGYPRSVWILEFLLSLTFLIASRAIIRVGAGEDVRGLRPVGQGRRRTLLYGAGQAGALVARSAAREPMAGVEPVGFLDDDPLRKHSRVAGLPVFGGQDALTDAIALTDAQVLLITMPAAAGSAIRRVTRAGMAAGLEVRTVPAIHELIDGSVDAYRVRRVKVEDLIRRPEVSRLGDEVEAIVRDRVVLVTGAAGSIGAELVRQVFALGPSRLVLVDRAESPLYSIQRELEVRASTGTGRGEVVIHLANVASRALIQRIVDESRPDVILHAAAYKHVPLLEEHPSEAVQVNVGGTSSVLDAATEAGTEHFVLVSTDKAVAPRCAMGASKRVAEWLVADVARRTGHPYVSVRFGNVLGSAGSVIPIFQQQLEQSQPLTITHPEMTRYFMTIPEASSLILEAATIGGPGDLVVLDMGQPLRILDLANDLVRLAGRDPEAVPYVFTGLRPGEKLHEQLFYERESTRRTRNPKVLLAEGEPPPRDIRGLALELLGLADGTRERLLRDRLFEIVLAGSSTEGLASRQTPGRGRMSAAAAPPN